MSCRSLEDTGTRCRTPARRLPGLPRRRTALRQRGQCGGSRRAAAARPRAWNAPGGPRLGGKPSAGERTAVSFDAGDDVGVPFTWERSRTLCCGPTAPASIDSSLRLVATECGHLCPRAWVARSYSARLPASCLQSVCSEKSGATTPSRASPKSSMCRWVLNGSGSERAHPPARRNHGCLSGVHTCQACRMHLNVMNCESSIPGPGPWRYLRGRRR